METKLKTLKNFLSDLKHDLKELSKMKFEDINDEYKCKYFYNLVRSVSTTYRLVNREINNILKPSHFYKSQTIKRLIISNVRNKTYVCDELSFGNVRFDVLSVERYTDNPKVIGYEVKTSKSDLIADEKYKKYLSYCNILYFVVPENLKDEALSKITSSSLSKHIGLYIVSDNGELKLTKRARKNNNNLNTKAIQEKIVYSAYNRYIYE